MIMQFLNLSMYGIGVLMSTLHIKDKPNSFFPLRNMKRRIGCCFYINALLIISCTLSLSNSDTVSKE